MWLLVAACVGLFSWWMTGLLAGRVSGFGPLDHPNDRSLHQVPTPRMGGVAIAMGGVVGIVLSTLLGFPTEGEGGAGLETHPQVFWILGGVFLLAIISFVDDRWGIPVSLRLACHVLAAAGAVFGGGVSLSVIQMPGWGEIGLGWFGAPITLMFLVWMTNLYNFMDGMDGFAGGMTVLGFGMLAYLFWIGHDPVLFYLAVVQAAAGMGFLLHNFPPARIFMGDVGSISTGFLAGCLIVLGCREKVFDLWVPLMVFSPFVIDATVTLLRRALRCENIWHAHREHYYQRVVLSGWSHRRTVLAEYAVMAFCGMLALLYHGSTEGMRLIILAAWIVLFLALAAFVSRLQGGAGVEMVR